MAKTPKELKALIQQAKADVRKRGHAVEKAQDRQNKFGHKYQAAKKERNQHFAKLREARADHKWVKAQNQKAAVAFYQRRMARAKNKVRLWHRRELDAISDARGAKRRLGKWVSKLRALSPANAKRLLDKARSTLGTREGTNRQREWANKLGLSWVLPWCSIWVANMLMESGMYSREQLPSGPAYSGSWINWNHARRVDRSSARPGDVLVLDWGDGGMTDHVALLDSGGYMIGGNQSDNVTRIPVPWGNVVAVMRPDKN